MLAKIFTLNPIVFITLTSGGQIEFNILCKIPSYAMQVFQAKVKWTWKYDLNSGFQLRIEI